MSSSSGRSRDVLERALPALLGGLERDLLDLVGVDADRVAARAEAAVDRAGVEREEQRLVGIAVREARRPARRPARAASRASSFGWSGRRRDATGMNWRRSGSLYGVAPVDQRQQVRRHADRHRRAAGSPASTSSMKLCGHEVLDRGEQLRRVRDRVLRLPVVIEERGLVDQRGTPGCAARTAPSSSWRWCSVDGSTCGFRC